MVYLKCGSADENQTHSLDFSNILCLLFLAASVSVSDLQPHAELDPDSDGSFTEAEAQVCLNSRSRRDVERI